MPLSSAPPVTLRNSSYMFLWKAESLNLVPSPPPGPTTSSAQLLFPCSRPVQKQPSKNARISHCPSFQRQVSGGCNVQHGPESSGKRTARDFPSGAGARSLPLALLGQGWPRHCTPRGITGGPETPAPFQGVRWPEMPGIC